jgi:hypothetical protein
MADHVGSTRFTVATGVQVDFCDLRSPWQRAMKHTNGLLPEDFPNVAIWAYTTRLTWTLSPPSSTAVLDRLLLGDTVRGVRPSVAMTA